MIQEWRLAAGDLRQDQNTHWRWEGGAQQVVFRYISIEIPPGDLTVGSTALVYASWDQPQPILPEFLDPGVGQYQGSLFPGGARSWDTGLLAARKVSLSSFSFFEAVVRVSDEPFAETSLTAPAPSDSSGVPIVTFAANQTVIVGADGPVRQTESSTPLGANASFNGATWDLQGSLSQPQQFYSKIRAMVYANQAGFISMQQSRDGATWRTTVGPVPVPNSTAVVIESLIVRRYARVTYTNGISAQGIFELDSALVPA